MTIKTARKLAKRTLKTPKYEPNKWRNAKGAGCYPYAINLLKNEFFVVGEFIGKRCTEKTSNEDLVKTLKEELDVLGYNAEEIDVEEAISEDEMKIYLQREEQTGYYHFLREDADGLWSHKYPDELPTRQDSAGYIIKDPECMVEIPFIGWCFKLSKNEKAC